MAKKSSFGNLQKLPSGNYRARFKFAGVWQNAPYTFPSKQEAQIWLAEQHVALGRGEWEPPTEVAKRQKAKAARGITMNEWIDRWLQICEERGYSPNTIRTYISNCRAHIRPQLGSLYLKDVTKDVVKTWYRNFPADKRGARSAIYRTLSSLMAVAVEEELITESPVAIKGAMSKPRVRDEARERVAELEDVQRIAESMREARYRICVWLAACAGLRYSEIAALRLKHYDKKAGVLKIRAAVKRTHTGATVEGVPKTKTSVRDVPISPILRKKLDEHIRLYLPEADRDALLVQSPRTVGTDAFLSNNSLHRYYNPACAAAGLPGFGFHQLRATCATQLMRAGATPAEIQAILGHSDWATSMLYQRAPKERLAEAVGRMWQ